jgi:hypothetical protein
MSNTLALTIPSLTTQGPQYAQIINTDLQQITVHNHDGVNGGALIYINGQTVNGDLALDGYNLSNVRSIQYLNNSAILTGSQDVNSLYVQQNILGFNNSNGIFVPIVEGNTIAVTTLPFTNFSIRSVSSNFTILNTDTYNTIDINSTAGPVTGTLPIAAIISPLASGRLYLFKDVSGTAATNNITIQVAVASGNTFAANNATSIVIDNNYGYVALYTDGVSKWFTWTQNMYNTENLYLTNESVLDINGSTLNLHGVSALNADNTVLAQFLGSEVVFGSNATFLVSTGTITSFDASSVIFQNAATEEFKTGTHQTMDSGSTLTLNGTLNGTTTTGTLNIGGGGTISVSGTLSLPGTTNLNGTSTMTGTANHLTGTFGVVAGTIALTSAGQITVDRFSSYTAGGMTNISGEALAVTVLTTPVSYNVDSGTNFDNIICPAVGTTPSGTWTITMPASPASGRQITVTDYQGPDPATSTYTVHVLGNGHNFGITGSPTGPTPPSLSSTYSIGYGGNFDYGFWSVTFTFLVDKWIVTTGATLQ